MAAFALIGGIISTVGAVQQAEEERATAEFYAAQEAENSRLARREAEAIKVMGAQEQAQLRQQSLAHQGRMRTGYASSGLVLASGTVLDYEADIADAYDLDRRNLEYDLESRQWQKKVAAANARSQSNMYATQAAAAERRRTTSLWSGIFTTAAATLQGFKTDMETANQASGGRLF
jgi:hypothetical protein